MQVKHTHIHTHTYIYTHTKTDPATLSDKQREAKGIVRLPTTLKESLKSFKECGVFKSAMGESLFDAFCAVRENECEHFEKMKLEEEVQVLFDKY